MLNNFKSRNIKIFLEKENKKFLLNNVACIKCKYFVKCHSYNYNCQLYEYIKTRVDKATMTENEIIIKNADELKTVTVINRAIRLRKLKNFSR